MAMVKKKFSECGAIKDLKWNANEVEVFQAESAPDFIAALVLNTQTMCALWASCASCHTPPANATWNVSALVQDCCMFWITAVGFLLLFLFVFGQASSTLGWMLVWKWPWTPDFPASTFWVPSVGLWVWVTMSSWTVVLFTVHRESSVLTETW